MPCTSLAATTSLALGGSSVLTPRSLNNYSTVSASDSTYSTIVNPAFTSGNNTVALHSTHMQINSQASAFIGTGANTAQLAMGATGVGLQYGQTTGIFVNPTNIEVSGPLIFDNMSGVFLREHTMGLC